MRTNGTNSAILENPVEIIDLDSREYAVLDFIGIAILITLATLGSVALCEAAPEKPTLHVWSSAGWQDRNKRWHFVCRPCGLFWNHYMGDPEFRAALNERFTITFVDSSLQKNQQALRSQQIKELPSFVGPGTRIVGYEGKRWLLDRLDRLRVTTAPTGKPASPPAAHTGGKAGTSRTERAPVDRPSPKTMGVSQGYLSFVHSAVPPGTPRHSNGELASRLESIEKRLIQLEKTLSALTDVLADNVKARVDLRSKVSELSAKFESLKKSRAADRLRRPTPSRKNRTDLLNTQPRRGV